MNKRGPKVEMEGGHIRRYEHGAGWWAYAKAADDGLAWRALLRTHAKAEAFVRSGGKGGRRPARNGLRWEENK